MISPHPPGTEKGEGYCQNDSIDFHLDRLTELSYRAGSVYFKGVLFLVWTSKDESSYRSHPESDFRKCCQVISSSFFAFILFLYFLECLWDVSSTIIKKISWIILFLQVLQSEQSVHNGWRKRKKTWKHTRHLIDRRTKSREWNTHF